VAAKVLEDQSWKIPDFHKQTQSDLHPDIHQAWANLRTLMRSLRGCSLSVIQKPSFYNFSACIGKNAQSAGKLLEDIAKQRHTPS